MADAVGRGLLPAGRRQLRQHRVLPPGDAAPGGDPAPGQRAPQHGLGCAAQPSKAWRETRREKRSWNVAGHPAGSSSSVVGCGRGTSAWSRSGSGSSAPPAGSELGDSDSEGLVGCSEAGHFRSSLATKAAGSAESATIAAATASDKAGFSAAVTRAAVTACGDGISVESDQTLRLRPAVRRRARAVLARLGHPRADTSLLARPPCWLTSVLARPHRWVQRSLVRSSST